jgi:molybdopterin molybdotransferase
MNEMIAVQEAEARVLECAQLFLQASCSIDQIVKSVPLKNGYGSILAESIVADRDFPPYDRVAMDGIALVGKELLNHKNRKSGGKISFVIEGVQAAGAPPLTLKDSLNCVEVMTGAVLPIGTDTVIRYEDVSIEKKENGAFDKIAVILEPSICENLAYKNIHYQGSDRKKGSVLLEAGTKMLGPQIAVAATVGKSTLQVQVSSEPNSTQSIQDTQTVRKWTAAIVATGDELVSVSDIPEPHQIRSSNLEALHGMLCPALGKENVWTQKIKDDPVTMKREMETMLAEKDLLILSGGVSKGKFDYVPELLEELGVQCIFHKIKQKPGKPMWFGYHKQYNTVVFGLPGNPVSSLVCFRRYVVPFLTAVSGFSKERLHYPCPNYEPTKKQKQSTLTHFIPVHLKKGKQENEEQGKKPYLEKTPMNGSGDVAGLGTSDGFIEVNPSNEDCGTEEDASLQKPYAYYSWGIV